MTVVRRAFGLVVLASALGLQAGAAFAQDPPAASSAASAEKVAPAASAASTGPSPGVTAQGDVMQAYQAALAARRLGPTAPLGLDEVRRRVAEGERLLGEGRIDEAIAVLLDLVETPRFSPFAEDEAGRAAVYRLGDAFATAGAYGPARAYLRRVLATKGAWNGSAPYARRAVRRLVEIAQERGDYAGGLEDLHGVPPEAPAEVKGELAYLRGRAAEAAGRPDDALKAYAEVPDTSRFWAQATYLSGLVHVEKGRYKEGEDLFCRVADPKRQKRTTPVLADERYFAVRDLARLALGRVAHEQRRHDDARYYYYLVPRDSDRLAEALYESATTRYEKKDYDGARELLDELAGLGIHHRYEDEAAVLDAYIDLALCRFDSADQKLRAFLAKYEPVRDAARRLETDEPSLRALLEASRKGQDPGSVSTDRATSPEARRTIAALVRIDPAYGETARRRAVAERELSGLRLTRAAVDDLARTLATNSGVRPALAQDEDVVGKREQLTLAVEGVQRALTELSAARAPEAKLAPLREELRALEAKIAALPEGGAGRGASGEGGQDLPGLLQSDAARAYAQTAALTALHDELAKAETLLAKDALHRLDLRLSRLLRRARLGRIESVLGRKRALEVEVEAIGNGFLPQGALDSLDVARYLKDNEEYWPFEGDDWPDEYVGSEVVR